MFLYCNLFHSALNLLTSIKHNKFNRLQFNIQKPNTIYPICQWDPLHWTVYNLLPLLGDRWKKNVFNNITHFTVSCFFNSSVCLFFFWYLNSHWIVILPLGKWALCRWLQIHKKGLQDTEEFLTLFHIESMPSIFKDHNLSIVPYMPALQIQWVLNSKVKVASTIREFLY